MTRLVIVGLSHILSDVVDCAAELGHEVTHVLVDGALPHRARDLPWDQRLAQWASIGIRPRVMPMAAWQPEGAESLILGPTTPQRYRLQARIEAAHGLLDWATLVHPGAQVSRLATVGPGSFVGAGAVLAAGVSLSSHVFVNRCAAVGHDTRIGDYSRVQPGAVLGGMVEVGRGVTIGMGAIVIERLLVGDGATVAAGAVVTADVAEQTLVAGSPAVLRQSRQARFDG